MPPVEAEGGREGMPLRFTSYARRQGTLTCNVQNAKRKTVLERKDVEEGGSTPRRISRWYNMDKIYAPVVLPAREGVRSPHPMITVSVIQSKEGAIHAVINPISVFGTVIIPIPMDCDGEIIIS
jgi:hypothetical protein